MSTVDNTLGGPNRLDEYRYVIDAAGRRFASLVVLLVFGFPLVAYVSGVVQALFYVHITLAAVWVGTDIFFRYSLAPAVGAAGPETAMSLIPNLTPRLMIVGESLTLGVIGSGIGLAHRLGYLANPSVWIWGALGIAIVMLFFAFVPLHHYQIEMLFELDSSDPDGERIGELNDTAMRWLMGMTVLLVVMLLMMTGIRWGITL